jgi:hypothetical protein
MLSKRRLGLMVVFLGAALILFFALERVSDMVFYPWALADPPLLDNWAGSLTTGNGVRMVVGIELRRARTDQGMTVCATCSQIEGSGATCDAHGTVLQYRVSGSPTDRRGSQLHLGAVPEPQPPPDGLELDVLRGTWDGGNVLALEADFFWRRGTAGVSSTDDPATQPVPLRMERKGPSEFEAMCKSLAAGRGAAR